MMQSHRPIYSLRLDEDKCELAVYADCHYISGFKLDALHTSTDVLHALWQFSNQHAHSPALIGAVVKSLRTLLVGRNADEPSSTLYGFKPAPLDKWKGTRVAAPVVQQV